LRQGKTRQGIEILQRVVDHKPKMSPARLDLGYALLNAGYTREARAQFNEAINIGKDIARANLGLANCAFIEGDWAGAANMAAFVRTLGQSNFQVVFLLARAAKLAGDLICMPKPSLKPGPSRKRPSN